MEAGPEHGPPDPTRRFSSRVRDYARYRPGYPPEVLEWARRSVGLLQSWVVADVGSGTGISSELFLAHGNTVYGVEPNAAMREAAEEALDRRPGFYSLDGSAEATTLPVGSVDLVVCAQAFHWFDVDRARAEFGRILRPPGRVVLLWNERRTSGSPFLEAYERLLLEHGTDYGRVRHENVTNDATLARFFGTGGYAEAKFANAQRFDFEGLTGRLLSSSYTPAEGDPRRGPMLAALRELFDRHQSAGRVTMDYVTRAYHGSIATAGTGPTIAAR